MQYLDPFYQYNCCNINNIGSAGNWLAPSPQLGCYPSHECPIPRPGDRSALPTLHSADPGTIIRSAPRLLIRWTGCLPCMYYMEDEKETGATTTTREPGSAWLFPW